MDQKSSVTMQKNNNISKTLMDSILKIRTKGAFFITVISVLASVLIYITMTSVFGIALSPFGFVAATLIPTIVAYPSIYIVLKMTNIIQAKNQEIEMKNSLKNTLLSVVAHDVKGPLMNIDMLLELYFQKEIRQEELLGLLKELQQQVKTNLDFVMNILQWTKTQFDGFQVIKNKTDLKLLIDRMLNAYQFQIQQKKITVETDVDLTANIDRDLIRLVLRNLLSNAIKYSETGGKISISAKIENGILVTSVMDNGLGIEPEKLKSIFNENVLDSSKGTYMETGTGLGLKLCKTFINALGGTIGAESEPGKGSTFYFTIPQD
ncbi:MAG: hypothetical protein A2W90_08900 [Bacteroidetes bacterium GWF2_42_66]|nr:MAG: hypothetical protein A2W92_17145 [Bacteroidetes bacterium GWA2_42_15]OFX97107.1 MAG: hypothetical protein A2W89_00025 [Bacteroidetes bacterium GWE2_42_39]OFY46178.1 MAG: hypothetical protein A2W90_08900 [Bacteroidetes bacterium GWF2_42_66]